MTFTIQLANRNIRIHSLYKNIYRMCKDYLVEEEAFDFEIFSSEEDIEKERDSEHYSSEYLETLSIYRKNSAANVRLFNAFDAWLGNRNR
ncbi:MAG: hypothetical protein KBT48_07410 [Firmicutes bacterium]|nr:hypothetical protein [Bacillota bacterium]